MSDVFTEDVFSDELHIGEIFIAPFEQVKLLLGINQNVQVACRLKNNIFTFHFFSFHFLPSCSNARSWKWIEFCGAPKSQDTPRQGNARRAERKFLK